MCKGPCYETRARRHGASPHEYARLSSSAFSLIPTVKAIDTQLLQSSNRSQRPLTNSATRPSGIAVSCFSNIARPLFLPKSKSATGA